MKCTQEQAVYIRGEIGANIIIGVYVDDLIVTGEDAATIADFKKKMFGEFDMSDLGMLHYYLRIEVAQENGEITIKQTAYAKKILGVSGRCLRVSSHYRVSQVPTPYSAGSLFRSWDGEQIYGAADCDASQSSETNSKIFEGYNALWFSVWQRRRSRRNHGLHR